MFWKFDEEEDKVVPREEKPKFDMTPSEFAERARETGHASLIDTLEEEDKEVILKSLEEQEDDGFVSSDETGAEKRFEGRVAVFKKEDKPVYKHHFWWFVHNCIAHPAIGILPNKSTFDFHDWTSKKINGK